MHDICYLKLYSPRKLPRIEKPKEEQSQYVVSQDESSFSSSTTVTNESFSSPPSTRTRSASIAQNKTKCIWCFNGPDKKHLDRKFSK